MKRVTTLFIVALLGLGLTFEANTAPEKSILKKEHKSYFKRKENNCMAMLRAPITKFFYPPTYFRFVLKNKKGVFLNIKIGCIN